MKNRSHRRRSGFILLEMLLVVAILMLLGLQAFGVLGKVQNRAHAAHCLNNQRQLTLAWLMYAEDQDQRMVSNGFQDDATEQKEKLWVSGGSHRSLMPFLDTGHLLNPELAAFAGYIENPNLYKCPEDHRTRRVFRAEFNQIRSYSINGFLGPTAAFSRFNTPGYREYQKLSALVRRKPAGTFVFMDVNPFSICFPAFLVEMPGLNSASHNHQGLFHYPSTLHGGSGIGAFADGHAEQHRWRDTRTAHPTIHQNPSDPGDQVASHAELSPHNPDLKWIQDRATTKE